MIPTLLEVQERFIELKCRDLKKPLQFFAYYNFIGWPHKGHTWQSRAWDFIEKYKYK